jgi:hypothetical protein
MRSLDRTALWGAGMTFAGVILSGPAGMWLVTLHPQPAWTGPEAFARAYHPVQTLPYFLGFLLVGGAVTMIAGLAARAPEDLAGRATTAVAFSAAFAALIFFNYVVQTTFVPALVRDYRAEDGPLVAALTLSNPRALGWALEMWGYAVLGIATWLVAPVLAREGRLGRAAAALFVANGPVSVAGGLWTALEPGWVMSTAGMSLFVFWNLLVAVMSVLAIGALKGWRGLPRPSLGGAS